MPQKEVCHGGSRSALNVKCNLLSIPAAMAHWSISLNSAGALDKAGMKRSKTEKGHAKRRALL